MAGIIVDDRNCHLITVVIGLAAGLSNGEFCPGREYATSPSKSAGARCHKNLTSWGRTISLFINSLQIEIGLI
jgi:hypothetical protein